ncbi:unnamed protein product, partial [Porites lobata]
AIRRSRSYLRGRLFCLQLYSVALNRKQIFEAKRKCFLPGPKPTPPPPTPAPTPPPRICRARIDLGFLIDGSRQTGTATFVRIIQYVKETVR